MEEKLVSRDCSPPVEVKSASSSVENGWRDAITRSAPSSARDCSSTEVSRLLRKHPIATRAATPKTTLREKTIKRRRLLRVSRQAIFHVHGNRKSILSPLCALLAGD